jgi:Flp pilus assembly pilin Flp
MRKPSPALRCRFRKQTAQSLAEYSVILALVAMVAVVILRAIGTTTSNSMLPVNSALAE